jgi:proline iminopeptidase
MKPILATLSLLAAISFAPTHAQLQNAQPEWYLRTSDGCKLFVQEFGQGPETIVVLHGGWGAEHSYLLDVFRGIDTHYHLVFYDQRGSLLSPCPLEKISVQKHVDDLEQIRLALGLDRLNIVAHSMGTFLAMDYLQQHPDRVKGLVLMGSLSPKADAQSMQDQQNGAMALMNRPEVKAELLSRGLDPKNGQPWTPQKDALAWHINFASVNLYHIDRWQQLKGGGAYYNGDAGQAAAKTMPQTWDFTPALAARTCSTWVIDGDHDYVDASGKLFHAATANIPNVHIVALKDAEHASWIDAPEAFHQVLTEALADTTRCTEPTPQIHP